MMWPWTHRYRELHHETAVQRAELQKDLARLQHAKQQRAYVRSLVSHLPQRREENHISEGLERLYEWRRRFR